MLESIDRRDAARLRELGKQIADIAAHPEQDRNRKIWTAVNDGAMTVPAVLARDYPVYLLDQDTDELTTSCSDPFLKTVEADLLLKIYEWKHLRCHRVVENFVDCQADIDDSGFGIEVSSPGADDITGVAASEISNARHFDRIIDGEEDLAMIRTPVVTHNGAGTRRRLEALHEIFDGVIDVKLHGADYFQYVPWDDLLSWMGIEEGMYDFVLNPDFMHTAIERMTDAWIACVTQYETLGLVTSNNGNCVIGAGGYGYTNLLPKPTASGIGAKLKDVWGFAADQIMTSVSPEMSEEFAFTHEKRYADLFGIIYYGCCERLDHKLDELRTFSNLRKVSMSPYANIEEGMEKMGGGDRVVSFKPNSNHLAVNPPEMKLLRRELENVCSLARKHNCNLEIIIKTIITLRGEPRRLWQWCDMAMEVVSGY